MHARWTLSGVVALAFAAGGPSPVVQATGPTVTIEDLGPSGFVTGGRAVNAGAFAVGYGTDGFVSFGFTQHAAPLVVPLPIGATDLQAVAVNDAGVATGRYIALDGFARPYRYDSVSNLVTDVPLLATATNGTGTAINAAGVVAGFSNPGGKTHGFLHAPGGPVVDVGDLGGGFSSLAGINASNVAVGMSRDAANLFKAARYDGTLHPMVSLGGSFASATAINAAGVIVGYSTTASNQTLAARWTNDTSVSSLGTLGGAWSQAWAVNTAGEIVGASANASGQSHAWLWKDGTLQDLNDLLEAGSGWTLTAAYGINDNGVIVGDGVLDGVARGFRLTLPSSDTTAPVVSSVKATPDWLYPPNHQLVPVSVAVNASDDSGTAPQCQLVRVSSSDPDNGTGDGDTAGDSTITGPLSALLRAERSGSKERVYTLTVQCTDEAGNVATATASVRVPKNASGK
jgi:probable HAF family extracellular repeat protein